jgi:hypothetical protein
MHIVHHSAPNDAVGSHAILQPLALTMHLMEGKPSFGEIRKAVQGSAEGKAEDEFLKKPETRHYAEALDDFRVIRSIDPEVAREVIGLWAAMKEMKDKLGPERFKSFETVMREKENLLTPRLQRGVDQVAEHATDNAELKEKVMELVGRYIVDLTQEVRNDPRTQAAFVGADDLLEEAIAFIKEKTQPVMRIMLGATGL